MKFELKTKIIIGEDDLKNVIKYKRVLIVCDPFLTKNGSTSLLQESLNKLDVKTDIFDEIQPDPNIDIVVKCVKAAKKCEAEAIIALGGGSAIDTAKAVKFVYIKTYNDNIALIAIPTTSGTGSEVTNFTIIKDEEDQSKKTIVDDSINPDIAVLDYRYTLTVPKNVTANTGIDVLTHCMEAYVSNKATDFSDALAEKSVSIVHEFLPITVDNGNNVEARHRMHNASCMAGIAFTNASLGLCHSMAHALGGHFHLPHGLACALLLPYVVEYNSLKDTTGIAQEKYLKLAKIFGITGGSKNIAIMNFVAKLKRFIKEIGIETDIKSLNFNKQEFLSKVSQMSNEAMNDKCTLSNPVKPTTEDIETIYRKLLSR